MRPQQEELIVKWRAEEVWSRRRCRRDDAVNQRGSALSDGAAAVGSVAKRMIDGSAGRHFVGVVLISVVSQTSCKNSRERERGRKREGEQLLCDSQNRRLCGQLLPRRAV